MNSVQKGKSVIAATEQNYKQENRFIISDGPKLLLDQSIELMTNTIQIF